MAMSMRYQPKTLGISCFISGITAVIESFVVSRKPPLEIDGLRDSVRSAFFQVVESQGSIGLGLLPEEAARLYWDGRTGEVVFEFFPTD